MSVYALKDPRDGRVRYVGQSRSVRERFQQHVRMAHSESLRAWIGELRAQSLIPDLVRLDGDATEREWIEELRPDLNVVQGLDMPSNPRMERSAMLSPIRVEPEDMIALKERATACDLTVTEYVRYRVFGKKVLTGEQLERVRKNEKPID